MKILRSVEAVRAWVNESSDTRQVGFVPTMGALHAGHLSLVERSNADGCRTVVSIFVNPTQFNEAADCETYPRDEEGDLRMCREAGAQAVYLPDYDQIYPDRFAFKLQETDYATKYEGKARPGHFDGVLTVVMRLFNIVQPDHAYFGEKDWQQLRLIQKMVDAFHMPIRVVGCPSVREPDGLAMSSRNRRLSAEARARAPLFVRAMREQATPEAAEAALKGDGFEVEYVADFDGRRVGAVRLGGVRLIDNISLDEVEAGARGGAQ